MTITTLVATFLANIPELMKLVRLVLKNIEEAQRDETAKSDLKAINEAFATKDANALRRIFAPRDNIDG